MIPLRWRFASPSKFQVIENEFPSWKSSGESKGEITCNPLPVRFSLEFTSKTMGLVVNGVIYERFLPG